MKPSAIEDQIVSFTKKSSGRTVTGRMTLYKRYGEPDQWRLIYQTNPAGGLRLEEDILIPFEAYEDVRLVDGKLVLELE
jgi:hypothetical protein